MRALPAIGGTIRRPPQSSHRRSRYRRRVISALLLVTEQTDNAARLRADSWRYARLPDDGEAMTDEDNATAAAIRELAKQVDQLGNAIQSAAQVIAKAIAGGQLGGP